MCVWKTVNHVMVLEYDLSTESLNQEDVYDFSSDSSDCNSTKIATNTLFRGKRSHIPDYWARNLEKCKRTKSLT